MVNGALEYLAKDLGITENTVLQGSFLYKCVHRYISLCMSITLKFFIDLISNKNFLHVKMQFVLCTHKEKIFSIHDYSVHANGTVNISSKLTKLYWKKPKSHID